MKVALWGALTDDWLVVQRADESVDNLAAGWAAQKADLLEMRSVE